MKIRLILIGLVSVALVLLMAMYIIYLTAASICEESKVLPFRYVSQGLFGQTLTKIQTTPENADGYARLCIRTGNPEFFKLTENINYIVNSGVENE